MHFSLVKGRSLETANIEFERQTFWHEFCLHSGDIFTRKAPEGTAFKVPYCSPVPGNFVKLAWGPGSVYSMFTLFPNMIMGEEYRSDSGQQRENIFKEKFGC